MKRAIIVPPVPAPEALAELKQWLGLTGTARGRRADPADRCGARHVRGLHRPGAARPRPPRKCSPPTALAARWPRARSRRSLAVEAVAANGARTALAAEAYALELDADGGARVRRGEPGCAPAAIAVRFVAGLAANWSALPESLRHGIIRFAAHQHRARENCSPSRSRPAAVTALWRPWRVMRLA